MQSKKSIIFRKRLLSYSETFIADQGINLDRYQAVFCGYSSDNSGIHLLEGCELNLLDQYSRFVGLAKLRHRMGLVSDASWIDSLKSYHANLLHAHFLNDGLDALNLGKQLDIPVITTLHGHDITKNTKKTLLRKDTRYFFEHVNKVIAVSDYIAGHALRKGCPESKLIRHSIGIDLDRFRQVKKESDKPSLLFVGRLVEKKGCTYLLQAMEMLTEKYPDLSLILVGDGELRPSLQQEAAERNLTVEFVGTQTSDQIRELLASCWLFVAPSITAADGDAEGLGMVFLEAQALHTPVISFRSGGVVEAVENEKTGLLCDEKDIKALAHNMDTLLENASLRREMGTQGRLRVEKQFDVRKQCKLLESIYDQVSHRG